MFSGIVLISVSPIIEFGPDLGGPTVRSDVQRNVHWGLHALKLRGLKPKRDYSPTSGIEILFENSESAQFCSARLLSGHSSYRHNPSARLKGGRYKIVPVLSSHANSEAPTS